MARFCEQGNEISGSVKVMSLLPTRSVPLCYLKLLHNLFPSTSVTGLLRSKKKKIQIINHKFIIITIK